jgi:hypothetical protein
MTSAPDLNAILVPTIYKALERDLAEDPRPHLGASVIGHECERYVWLAWRWAQQERHDGRKLRLFATGQAEEARMVEDLRRVGAEVHAADDGGSQFRVSAEGGHFAGSADGVARNIPGANAEWHLLEFKTASRKTFGVVSTKGMRVAAPRHYQQMTVYMGLLQLSAGVYLLKNKDTDELYSERVLFVQDDFDRIMAKVRRLVRYEAPPERCSESPSFYVCKMCSFHNLCHAGRAPEVNCRTCAHSTPDASGTRGAWKCAKDASNSDIPIDVQRTGCGSHRVIPLFLDKTAKATGVRGDSVVYHTLDGGEFVNGDAPGEFSSQDMRDVESVAVLPTMAPLRAAFPRSRIVPHVT